MLTLLYYLLTTGWFLESGTNLSIDYGRQLLDASIEY